MSSVSRMTCKECAWALQKMIKHQEKMHKQDFYEMTPDGEKLLGKINPDNDLTYQTLLVALECVERALKTQKTIRALAFLLIGILLGRLTIFLIGLL